MNIEENEIKIEYNESFESDPLREDACQENQNFHDLVAEELHDNSNASTHSNDDYEQKLHSHKLDHHNALIMPENSTWFKSKDSNGKLLCKYCELKYSTVQTVRHHVKNKHPEEAKTLCKIIINNKRNRKHICHICKKRFKDLSNLSLHMTNHSMKSVETSCMHCNATFSNSEDLTGHIYMKHHRGNKRMYMCNKCGYRTLKKSHYDQHSNTHKENKDLSCKNCDYKTNYSPNMRIHEIIHTNDKPYACDYKDCKYKSSTKSALKSHKLKHFPKENILFCEKCSYCTVYKQSLKRHLDNHENKIVRIKRF